MAVAKNVDMAGILRRVIHKRIKMGFLFSSRPNKRVILSELFLRKDAEVAPKAKTARSNVRIPSPFFRVRRSSRQLLAMFLLMGTVVIVTILIISLKNAEPVLPTKTAVASKSAAPGNTIDAGSFEPKDDTKKAATPVDIDTVKVEQEPALQASPVTPSVTKNEETTSDEEEIVKTQYKVNVRAYFYNEPNERSGKKSLIRWKNSYPPFNALSEEKGFVYAMIADENNQTLEGWLRKKDLTQVQTRFYEGDLK